MMRLYLAAAAMLLPLAGCVVPPSAPYGYPQPYPQPGYPSAYSQADTAYPGYGYVDGSPTIVADGGTWPLIFYGGGWGYWDGYHTWHRAPDQVWRHLDSRYPGGAGYHPWGGGVPGGGHAFAPSPGGFHPGPAPGPAPRVGGFGPLVPTPGSNFRPGQTTGVQPAAAHASTPPQHQGGNGHRDDHH